MSQKGNPVSQMGDFVSRMGGSVSRMGDSFFKGGPVSVSDFYFDNKERDPGSRMGTQFPEKGILISEWVTRFPEKGTMVPKRPGLEKTFFRKPSPPFRKLIS